MSTKTGQIAEARDLLDNKGSPVKRGKQTYRHANGKWYNSNQRVKIVTGGLWRDFGVPVAPPVGAPVGPPPGAPAGLDLEELARIREQGRLRREKETQASERIREREAIAQRVSSAPQNLQAEFEAGNLPAQPAYAVGLGRRRGKGRSNAVSAIVGYTMDGQPIHNRAGVRIQRGGSFKLAVVRPDPLPLPLYTMQGFGRAPENPILDGRKYKGRGIRVFPMPI